MTVLNENEKLNDYLAAWDLSKPQLLAQTMTVVFTQSFTVTRKLF